MCRTLVGGTVVLSVLFAASAASAGKGGGSGGKSSGGTVHVKGHYRAGHYVQPHTRRAPGTAVHTYTAPVAPRMDARVTARGSVPVMPTIGTTKPPPELPPTDSNEDREAVMPAARPSPPEARTTARVSPPASSRTALAVRQQAKPKEVDPEQEAARLLTLAASVEESAKEAKADRRGRDAQRLFEAAERRYAEIVQKFPKTNAAGEARKAINRLQRG